MGYAGRRRVIGVGGQGAGTGRERMATVKARPKRRFFPAEGPDPFYFVWRRLTSVRFAIGLILTLALFALAGVIIPQVPPQLASTDLTIQQHIDAQRPTWGPFTDALAEFPWLYDTRGGVFNLFQQPYWFALVGLVGLSITVCTVSRFPPIWRTVRRPQRRVNDAYFARARHHLAFATPADPEALIAVLRRRRYRVRRDERDGAVYLFADRFQWAQLATFVTHTALLMIVGAALVTKFAGEEFQFWVAEGRSHVLYAPGSARPQVQIAVEDVSARFDDTGRALDFRSTVQVTRQGEEIGAGAVTVNGPLSSQGYRVHQAAYWENGAALEVRDAASGQLLYTEALMLQQQFVGPRVRMTRAETGEVLSEEVILLARPVADVEGAAYQLIPLGAERSLALVLAPDGPAAWRFSYALAPVAAESGLDPRAPALSAADLRLGQPPPPAPRVRLYDAASAALLIDAPVTLEDRISGTDARFGVIPVSNTQRIAVGYQQDGGEQRFFYFDFDDATRRGVLAPGERATLGAVDLEYVAPVPDASLSGSLAAGESQRVGQVLLTYAGPESVFWSIVPELPGGTSETLVLLERFGQERTGSQFDARGGERVVVNTTASSSGGVLDRPSRLGIGLGGGRARFDLAEGEATVVDGYEYRYLGPREFTGLNVRRDPGGTLLWIALGLGIGGLLVTFFVPRRRLWARITPERTALAGLAGHTVNFQREMAQYAREVGAADAPPRDEDWDGE